MPIKNNTAFKKSKLFDPEACTVEEARGHVLNRFNQIEVLVNAVIIEQVKPAEKYEFESIFLHSSILPFSAKISLLQLTGVITPKSQVRESFHKVMNIRNSFAHASIMKTYYIGRDPEIPDGIDVSHQLDVIEGGKLVSKNAKQLLNSFLKHYQMSNDFLVSVLPNKKVE